MPSSWDAAMLTVRGSASSCSASSSVVLPQLRERGRVALGVLVLLLAPFTPPLLLLLLLSALLVTKGASSPCKTNASTQSSVPCTQ
jgi:hypothetical protein